MKKLLLVVMFAACAMGVMAEEEEGVSEGVQKILLKISSVATPSTRAEKWNPPQIPLSAKELPFTESDIQKASPERALEMDRANRVIRYQNNRMEAAVAMQQYRDAMNHFKGTKAKLEGTAFGRQILMAMDKFAGAAGEYFDPDLIEFFHNMDSIGEAEEAALLSGTRDKKNEPLTAPYFIKLVFDDPRTESMKGYVSGTEMKRTTVKIGVTYQVQAMNGKMVTSGNVKATKSERDSGMGGAGEQSLVVDAIEEALNDVAKRINMFFVVKPTIKVVPSKKDKEFDADSATVTIDGESADVGEVSMLRGKHTIVVEMDGYKQVGSIRFDIKKSKDIKIKMKKVEEPKAEKESEE